MPQAACYLGIERKCTVSDTGIFRETFSVCLSIIKRISDTGTTVEFGGNYGVIEEKSTHGLPLMDKRRMLFHVCLSMDRTFKSSLLGAHKKI